MSLTAFLHKVTEHQEAVHLDERGTHIYTKIITVTCGQCVDRDKGGWKHSIWNKMMSELVTS